MPCPSTTLIPLSYAQQQFWFIDQFRTTDAPAHSPCVWTLHGSIDVDALTRALETIIKRHEALRARVVEIGGTPFQIYDVEPTLSISVESLDSLTRAEQDQILQSIVKFESGHKFRLETGPLFSFRLLRRSATEHCLIRTIHHIVFDGYSRDLFHREFMALYEAYRAHTQPSLETPRLQYGEYARSQREYGTHGGYDDGLAFWRQELAGVPFYLDLPSTKSPNRPRTYRGEQAWRVVDPTLRAAVAAQCRQQRVTPFMYMCACLQVVLSRWSGQTDFAIGIPVADRRDGRTLSAIGCFANMILIRADIERASTFDALLRHVRGRTSAALRHQSTPFNLVIERLRPPRDHGGNLPVQVVFNVVDRGFVPPDSRTLMVEPEVTFNAGVSRARFDITLYVIPHGDEQILKATYDSERFTKMELQELLDQFEGLIRQTVACAGDPLNRYSLTTVRAKKVVPDPGRQLSRTTNNTFLERFAANVSLSGDRPAVRTGNAVWTYEAIGALSDRVAVSLRERECQGRTVPIVAQRGVEVIAAIIGVWKAGASFVLIDAEWPSQRIREVIGPLESRCVVDARNITHVMRTNSDRNDGDEFARWLSIASLLHDKTKCERRLAGATNPANRAYLAVTSGTTGTPKVVCGTHAPLTHFLGWYLGTFGVLPSDRVSLLSSIGHDPFLRDIMVPLSAGAIACVPPNGVIDPDELFSWAHTNGITIMHLTPVLAKALSRRRRAGQLSTLRLACFSGDVLTSDDIAACAVMAPHASVVNTYGTTETPQIMSYWVAPMEAYRCEGELSCVPPIGQAIDDVQLLVINADGAQCGLQERGELCVRTPFLTTGYLNDENGTAERYVHVTGSRNADDRMYRTGDLGWYGVDGQVYFAGRRDEQLKVRGFRVDTCEIARVLLASVGVADAAIVKAVDDDGDDRLLAYVVPAGELDVEALRQSLKRRLPGYMIPVAILQIDRVPRTPTGKVDLKALPAPRRVSARSHMTPRNPVEQMMASVWSTVLGVEGVGIDDDFFDLGGHSMNAITAVAQVRERLGVHIGVRQLFETSTIRTFSEAMQAGNATPA